ncbi:hypothetical protein BOTCAL_0480g00050 [Botryotinia calthae]|uniref:Uncharacterized protein n=1 Tax=Botryotinia calthae TaxID=38488 RepID=A0A4Y8CM02_9HELO|nr:hypothetical protein BOTCAL_0480g00050 [Botryotinia calthae]
MEVEVKIAQTYTLHHGLSQANKLPTAAVNATIHQASCTQLTAPLNCVMIALLILVLLALAIVAVVPILVLAEEVFLAPLPPLTLELVDLVTEVIVKLPVGAKYPLLTVVVAFALLYSGPHFLLDPEINPSCEPAALEYTTVFLAPLGNERSVVVVLPSTHFSFPQTFPEALHIVHIFLFVEKPAVTGFKDELKRGGGRVILVYIVSEVEEGVDSLVGGFA